MIFYFHHHMQGNTCCIKRNHKVPCPSVIIFWHAQELCGLQKFDYYGANYFRICYVCAFTISDFISEF